MSSDATRADVGEIAVPFGLIGSGRSVAVWTCRARALDARADEYRPLLNLRERIHLARSP